MRLKRNRIGQARSIKLPKPWEIIRTTIVVALGVLMIGALTATCYQRMTSTGLYQREYEGKIVEKFLIPHESRTGSSAERALIIRGRGGEQFQVVVSRSTYERAEVGMWIKSSKAGVELSWSEP